MSDPAATRPSSGLVSADEQDQAIALALAFLAGYTGHTRDAYRRDLADWWRWCAAHDLAVLKAARVHVELYARELEAAGRAPSTVARRLAALAAAAGGDTHVRARGVRRRRWCIAPAPSCAVDAPIERGLCTSGFLEVSRTWRCAKRPA